MLQDLEKEREGIKGELAALREIGGYIYRAIMQMNKIFKLLYAALADAKRTMEREKAYWAFNCTAF